MKEGITLAHRNTEAIDEKIKGILSRGNTVCFFNASTGIVKFIAEWNQDEMGDLTADYSDGTSEFICPYSKSYEIVEVPRY